MPNCWSIPMTKNCDSVSITVAHMVVWDHTVKMKGCKVRLYVTLSLNKESWLTCRGSWLKYAYINFCVRHLGQGQFRARSFICTVLCWILGGNNRTRLTSPVLHLHPEVLTGVMSSPGITSSDLAPQLCSPWHKGMSCSAQIRWERMVRLREVWVSAVWRHLKSTQSMPGPLQRFVEEQAFPSVSNLNSILFF